MSRPLRIVLAGVWDEGPGYPRTTALRSALQQAGHSVVECRVGPPAQGASKTRLVSRPWRWPGWLRAAGRSRRALQKRLVALCEDPTTSPDLVLVPYPGHAAVCWVRAVWDGPLVLDLFLSAYTTAIVDRRLFPAWSPPARLLRRLDRRACRAADRVLLDTAQHCEQVAEVVGLPVERFDWVPVVDPKPPVNCSPVPDRRPGEPLELLFFGTGVPLHGLPVWLRAVAQVPELRLTLFGGDPRSRRLAAELLGDRVRLRAPFAPLAEIRDAIDAAHAVCGIVGSSAKARAVVPFKVVHALAHGRPVLTGDSAAVRALMTPGVDCAVAPVDDVAGLAAALRELVVADHAWLQDLGAHARRRFELSFSIDASVVRLQQVLADALGTSADTPEVAEPESAGRRTAQPLPQVAVRP